jgi:hypothetical protein
LGSRNDSSSRQIHLEEAERAKIKIFCEDHAYQSGPIAESYWASSELNS